MGEGRLMYLVDTNIFLELLRGRERSEECREFLEKVSRGELECGVSQFSVHAVEGMLADQPSAVEKFLDRVDRSAGLTVQTTGIEEERAVAGMEQGEVLDFDDRLQYFVAKKTGAEAIVSFDSDFDSTDLERIEPSELVELD